MGGAPCCAGESSLISSLLCVIQQNIIRVDHKQCVETRNMEGSIMQLWVCNERDSLHGWNGRLGQKNGTIECLVKQNTQSHNF